MINFPMANWRPPFKTTCIATSSVGQIATSFDAGDTWTLRTSGLASPTSAKNRLPYRCPGTGTILVPGTNASGYATVSRSVNRGVTWAPIATTFVGEFEAVISNGAGSWLAVGLSGAVWRSTNDGATWVDVSANLTSTETSKHLYALARATTGRIVAAGIYGFYYTDNFGDTWTQNTGWATPTGLTQFVAIPYGVNSVLLGSEWIKIRQTTGVGTPYLLYSYAATSYAISAIAIANGTGFALAAVNSAVGSGYPQLIYSADLVTWSDVSARIPGGITASCWAIAQTGANTWLLGFTGGKIARSVDGALTFSDISAASPFGISIILGLMAFTLPNDVIDLIAN